MGKKGATKNRGKRKSKSERKRAKAKDDVEIGIEGDLRVVSAHVKAFVEDGKEDEATAALVAMGRDAAFLVKQEADARAHEGLSELARRLAALPPQVDTNLYPLRRASVKARVEEAKADAPLAVQAENLMAVGGAVALFDPLKVVDDLVKSGRPRRDPARLEAGHLAWVGLPSAEGTPVRLLAEPPPRGQAVRRLRLDVQSGVVFVGPPEASDGPRLGTVRLDPFHTALDAHLEEGAFVRMKPGLYAVSAYLDAQRAVRIHLEPEPEPDLALATDPASLGDLPRA